MRGNKMSNKNNQNQISEESKNLFLFIGAGCCLIDSELKAVGIFCDSLLNYNCPFEIEFCGSLK